MKVRGMKVPPEFLAQIQGKVIRNVELSDDHESIAVTLRFDDGQSAELLLEHRHSARVFFMAGPEDDQVKEYAVRRGRR